MPSKKNVHFRFYTIDKIFREIKEFLEECAIISLKNFFTKLSEEKITGFITKLIDELIGKG